MGQGSLTPLIALSSKHQRFSSFSQSAGVTATEPCLGVSVISLVGPVLGSRSSHLWALSWGLDPLIMGLDLWALSWEPYNTAWGPCLGWPKPTNRTQLCSQFMGLEQYPLLGLNILPISTRAMHVGLKAGHQWALFT